MTAEKVVIIACRGAAELALDELMPFQGNLKTLPEENYRKLRDEILTDGFSEPFSVWQEPVDGSDGAYRYHVLNGHQRLTTLKRMRDNEDYRVPKLPVSFIEASDLRQAKRKVLALTSQFGVMTVDSLREFTVQSGLSFQDVSQSFRFAEVDLAALAPTSEEKKKVEFEAGPGGDDDKKADVYKEQYGVIVMCTDAKHQEETYNDLVSRGLPCKVVVT